MTNKWQNNDKQWQPQTPHDKNMTNPNDKKMKKKQQNNYFDEPQSVAARTF